MTDVFALHLALPPVAFAPASRYHGLEIARIEVDGEEYVYVRRRFVPPPEQLAVLGEHAVSQGERLDHVAARYLGDPEAFWRLCDANRALRPEELTEIIGRRLLITLPEGVPGPSHA
jgi:hypothetical protein